MENKYQLGKIYKIVDNGYNKCYYGSTIRELSSRMSGHRADHKKYILKSVTAGKLFDEYGVENCKIELVELFPCDSRSELEAREGFYIKNNECVNKNVPGQPNTDYYQANRDNILEKMKIHYETNKDEISVKHKAYYDTNKHSILDQKKIYYEQNKATIKEKMKTYYKNKKIKKQIDES